MGDLNSDDFYKVLGVDRKATEKDVAKAYKKLALKWRPDKNPDNKEKAEENFKKVTEAYEVLNDKEKRRQYDQFGKAALQGGGGFQGAGGGGASSSMNFQDADAIFKAFFGSDMGGGPFGEMGGGGPFGGGGSQTIFMDGSGGHFQGGQGGPFGGGGMGFNFGGPPGGGSFGGHQAKKRKPNTEQPDVIPEGSKVVIRALVSAAQHNDQKGSIEDFDREKGRYRVKLQGGVELLLKPENISLEVENVKMIGISSHVQLNGTLGRILKYDGEKDRYTILCHQGNQVVAIPTQNVILPNSTRVMIVGLTGAAQYNSRWGKIQQYEQADDKYTVQLSKDKCIKINRANCRCAG